MKEANKQIARQKYSMKEEQSFRHLNFEAILERLENTLEIQS